LRIERSSLKIEYRGRSRRVYRKTSDNKYEVGDFEEPEKKKVVVIGSW
jgi:hypothetical protein